MACATLKRSPDFDPVHNQANPRKRQRCGPVSIPSLSPTSTGSASRSENAQNSSLLSGVSSKLTPEMMAAGIREEIHRLHRKKLLHFHPKLVESTSTTDAMDSSNSLPSSVFPSNMRDKPLFTFRQVGIICERLISERENQIREEYERFLNLKLSEQYEAFVRFSNDQLRQRFEMGTTPSYLS